MKEAVLNLNISGMTTASCVSRIERALKKEPSVIEASINLDNEQAKVVYDAEKISSIDIVNYVLQAGFEVKSRNRRNIFKLNLGLALALTAPLFVSLLTGIEINPWLQLLLSTPVQFLCGRRFYKSAWRGLKKLKLNFELLVTIGSSAAYFLSLYILINQDIIEQGTYFESASVIITIALFGSYLESKSRKHSTETLRSLKNLLPLHASSYKLEDIVGIKPGDRIPVDGTIIEGFSQTDESRITGESFPVFKGFGDQVIGGSKNGDGYLKVKVSAVGEQTVLARTIRLIEDTQVKRASLQRIMDKFSSLIVLITLVIAAIVMRTTYAETLNWEESFIRAVALLIIASPCSLMLAIPTAIILGERVAAKNGVIIRDPKALETTQKTTFVAFDKAGILTEGKPFISHLLPLGISERDFLRIISSLQAGIDHPLAKAVRDYADSKEVPFTPANKTGSLAGQGVEGEIEGIFYGLIGQRLLNFPLPAEASDFLYERQKEGESVSFLVDQTHETVLGLVAFQDIVKDQSHMAINHLRAMGIKTALLTGDNESSAKNLARNLGIDIVHSDLFPEEKEELINHYKLKNVVAMAGDGSDDAPTLSIADISITMSSGGEDAIHNAGITLMRGNPQLISDAIAISRSTYLKIKQNLLWAFSFSVVGIPFAAFGTLGPSMAGRVMVFSSLCVLFNSLMLKRWKSIPRYR